MRLIDLAPRWLAIGPQRQGMGVSFVCPHCKIRLAVWFQNPIDNGSPIDPAVYHGTLWHRTGSSFNDLTLVPAIDAKERDPKTREVTVVHWHGFIHRGQLLFLN